MKATVGQIRSLIKEAVMGHAGSLTFSVAAPQGEDEWLSSGFEDMVHKLELSEDAMALAEGLRAAADWVEEHAGQDIQVEVD